jgi:hypothetical protein
VRSFSHSPKYFPDAAQHIAEEAMTRQRSEEGDRRLSREAWQAIRDRIEHIVHSLGGRRATAEALSVSERTIDGWLGQSYEKGITPGAPGLLRLGRLGFSPQWVLFGTMPPHTDVPAMPSDVLGAALSRDALANEVQRFVADALHKQGVRPWRVKAYLPTGGDLLDALVGDGLHELERRRMWKREQIALAVHDALEEGAANGYGPQLAMRFAAAFHEAQGGTNPPGAVTVHPVFSVACSDGDGVHDERVASGRPGTRVRRRR